MVRHTTQACAANHEYIYIFFMFDLKDTTLKRKKPIQAKLVSLIGYNPFMWLLDQPV